MSTGKPHQIRLRMTRTISVGNDGIFRSQQYLIIFIHQDCSKRMITMVTRGLSNVNRCSEMSKICIVHICSHYENDFEFQPTNSGKALRTSPYSLAASSHSVLPLAIARSSASGSTLIPKSKPVIELFL